MKEWGNTGIMEWGNERMAESRNENEGMNEFWKIN